MCWYKSQGVVFLQDNSKQFCSCDNFNSLLWGSIHHCDHFNPLLIAFPYNAKSFAIAILVFLFFIFFPSRHFFWTDCQKLFSQRFIMSYQESVWPRSESFLGHTKKSFYKSFPQVVIHDATRRVWHMTRLIHGNQYS